MAKIFVFRHAETIYNKDYDFTGIRDIDIDEEGILEAKKIAQNLKDERVTKAYQSNLVRSKHTLSIVLEGHEESVEVKTDERIKERDYGDLTGMSKDEFERLNAGEFALWHRSYDVAPPNGESLKDVERRVLEFLGDELPGWFENDTIFISAHGNSIRPMRRYFENLTIEQMCAYEYKPGEIFKYQM